MLRAYAALVVIGFVWGANFLYMKMATAVIDPLQVVFLRVLTGFIPLVLVAWQAGVLRRDQLRHLPHFAVMSVLATSFYYYGFVAGTARLPSSVAGLLGGAIPIVTFLTSLVFLRSERPNALMMAGVGVGFAGIVLTARPWEGGMTIDPVGVLWVLAGTISVGVSFVYARRHLSPLGLSPLALATWQTGLALLTLAAITDFSGMSAILGNSHALIGLVLGLGILGTGLAYLIYYYILQQLGAVGASSATYLPAVVAVAIGAAVGEEVTITEVLALTLILGGVALIQLGTRRIAAARVRSTSATTLA